MTTGRQPPISTGLDAPTIPEHQLLRTIAKGSYGEVWLARNLLGTYRGVKVVYQSKFDHPKPFHREFAGIRAFEPISRAHPNLVQVLQVGRQEGQGYFYYVMELADDLPPRRYGAAETSKSPETAGAREQSA